MGPHAVESHLPIGVDQVVRIGQVAVGLVSCSSQIVDEHQPGKAFITLVLPRLGELLLVGLIVAVPLAGMRLANEDIDEM